MVVYPETFSVAVSTHCMVLSSGCAVAVHIRCLLLNVIVGPEDGQQSCDVPSALHYGACCSGRLLQLQAKGGRPDQHEELPAWPLCAQSSGLEHTRWGNSSTNRNKTTSPFHWELLLVIQPVAFPGTWKWSLPCDAEKALGVSVHA